MSRNPAWRAHAIRRLRWITAALALILIPPLVVGGALLQHSAASHRRARVVRELNTQRDLEAQSLANYFTEARRLTITYANDPAFAAAFPNGAQTPVALARSRRAEAERAFGVLQRLYRGSIGESCLIARNGPEIARLVRGAPAPRADLSPDESGSTFFAGTFSLAPGEVYQARPYVSPDTHDWVISNSSQLVGFGRRAPAFAHFEISVESFRRRAAAQVGAAGLQVLDARSGAVVFDAHRPQRLGARLGMPGDHRFAAVVRSGKPRGVTTLAGRLVSFAHLPRAAGNANDWYVVAIAAPGALNGGIDAGALGLWLGAALLLLGLVVLSGFTRAIARRLVAVGTTAAAVARGELGEAVGERHAGVQGGDALDRLEAGFADMCGYLAEMAGAAERIAAGDLTVAVHPRSDEDRLGVAFAGMVLRLRELVGQLSGSSASLAAASQELASISGEAGHAVEEIAGASSDVARGAERQVQMVQAAHSAALEATEAATAGAQGARVSQSAAQSARGVVAEGVEAAAAAGDAIARISAANTQIAADIVALSERSERIGGIVDTITTLAEQTNLLALNAAIEAARAGEHGRGFAVVAEEVSRLAEASGSAAGEIARLVEEIQRQTRGVVATVEQGTQETERGVAIAARTQETFDQIGASVQSLSEQVAETVGVLEQIAGLNERMRREVTDVAAVAEQSSASAQQLSASTEQTSASTQEIASAAAGLARTAEQLDRALGEFRTSA